MISLQKLCKVLQDRLDRLQPEDPPFCVDDLPEEPLRYLGIVQALNALDAQHGAWLDAHLKRILLDFQDTHLQDTAWYLLEHRLRAALFHLEPLVGTQTSNAQPCVDASAESYAIVWAVTDLWPVSRAGWLDRAARLISAGKPLSTPPSEFW